MFSSCIRKAAAYSYTWCRASIHYLRGAQNVTVTPHTTVRSPQKKKKKIPGIPLWLAPGAHDNGDKAAWRRGGGRHKGHPSRQRRLQLQIKTVLIVTGFCFFLMESSDALQRVQKSEWAAGLNDRSCNITAFKSGALWRPTAAQD